MNSKTSAIKVCPFGSISGVANEASHTLTVLTKAMFIIIYSDIYQFLISTCPQKDQLMNSRRSATKIISQNHAYEYSF